MKKRILALLMATTLTFSLAACGSKAPAESNQDKPAQTQEAAAPAGEFNPDQAEDAMSIEEIRQANGNEVKVGDYKFGMVMKSLSNEFWRTLEEGYEAGAAEAGIQIDVQATTDEGDETGQQAMTETLTSQGVNALLMSPISDSNLTSAVESANDAGVLTVNVNDGLIAKANHYVGPNAYQNGLLAAEWISKQLGDEGDVAIVVGMAKAFAARERTAGFKAWIEENNSGLNIWAEQNADWDRTKAKDLAATWLTQNPNLKAIFCNNDDMALGVVEAVEEAGTDTLVVGVDGIGEAYESIRAGKLDATVDALIGENGAGKSTLLNILHGVYSDYEGDVLLHGKKINFKNANDAIKNGNISKVHQEIMVVEELTVGQNVTMGYEPKKGLFIDFNKMHQEVDEILEELNCNFRSRDIVKTLTAGQKQMIAIAKAIYHHSDIISFDEPTASLTSKETEALFAVIRKLKADGITILFVSHHLDELFEICDKASVFRDGEFVTTLTMAESNEDELIHAMVGRSVSSVASRLKPSQVKEEVVLKVEGLTDVTGGKFKDISFDLHKGEILGFYGLVGAGRTEVMRVLVGADQKLQGDIYLKNIKIPSNWNSTRALGRGIGMLSEDRKTTGFNKLATNTQNIAISSLEKYMTAGFFTNDAKKLKNAEYYFKELDINPKLPQYMTVNMSGGNQQKVIIAKWMSTDIDIIIFDEPTKGVDVAAKAEIYRLMEDLVAAGKSLIVVSSELPEAMGLSDRLVVMSEGRITKILDNRDEFDSDAILNYAIGGNE